VSSAFQAGPFHTYVGQRGSYTADELVSPLGDGAQGEVWHCAGTGGDFVIKVAKGLSSYRELRLELHALRKLNDAQRGGVPAVVEVVDGPADPNAPPFIVMQRYDCDLEAWIGRPRQEQSLRWRLQALVAFARAVQRLHGLSPAALGSVLVHRDIKPANALVRDRGDQPPLVVLADLGSARLTRRDSTHTRRGTRGFFPWEQMVEFVGPATVQQDVYGVGATVFWSIVGRTPRSVDLNDDGILEIRVPGGHMRPFLREEGQMLSDRGVPSDVPPARLARLDLFEQMRQQDRDHFERHFDRLARAEGLGWQYSRSARKLLVQHLFAALEPDYLARTDSVEPLVDALDQALLLLHKAADEPGEPWPEKRPDPPPVQQPSPVVAPPPSMAADVWLSLAVALLSVGLSSVVVLVLSPADVLVGALAVGGLGGVGARLARARGDQPLARLSAGLTVAAAAACVMAGLYLTGGVEPFSVVAAAP